MEQISNRLMNWASILEGKTRTQAEVTASMPFIHPHLALMPDAHLGKGATVGSVIPTLGAIIPAAVGVDIGCVDADTEYLSPTGWRRIADYDGGRVMQYDPATGSGSYVEPDAYVVKPCEEFYQLRTKYGIDQMLSQDHRVLCWKITGRGRRRIQTVLTAEQFAAEHSRLALGFRAEFATTFAPMVDTKLPLSDAQLRVQVMVHADAHLARDRIAVLHLKKTHKIERARRPCSRQLVGYPRFWTFPGPLGGPGAPDKHRGRVLVRSRCRLPSRVRTGLSWLDPEVRQQISGAHAVGGA